MNSLFFADAGRTHDRTQVKLDFKKSPSHVKCRDTWWVGRCPSDGKNVKWESVAQHLSLLGGGCQICDNMCFFSFIPSWGNDPTWRIILFKGVWFNHQLVVLYPKKIRLEQFVFASAVWLICGIRDFEVNLQAIQRYFLALEAFTDIIIQEGIQILWKGEYGELVVDA